MHPRIQFASFFVADITQPDTYQRGDIPLNKLTGKNNSILIRTEDCLLDEYAPLFSASMKDQRDLGKIQYSRINCLVRHQGKQASVLFEEKELTDKQFIQTPVFYPLYSYLLDLAAINYPVTLLHTDPTRFEMHPAYSLLGFPVISMEEIHFNRDALFISPYADEGPDYLFPRSFNEKDMDLMFTLRLE